MNKFLQRPIFRVKKLSYFINNNYSTGPPIIFESHEGPNSGILVATLNNPKTKNSISKLLLETFTKNVIDFKFNRDVRVLILKSAITNVFCSGADLKERKEMSEDEVRRFVDELRSFMDNLATLPFPTIAAIDGFAVGGGLEIALACDIRIASPTSMLGLVETKLAIIPGAGGTQRLPRIVGLAKAKEMIFTGKLLTGNEAAEIGLVNDVDQNPYQKALFMAKSIIKTGPLAIRLAKVAIDHGSQVELNSALAIEQQCYAQVINTKDRIEGLAAFAEKREPNFKGE